MKCVLLLLAFAFAVDAKFKHFWYDNHQIEWSGHNWRIKDRYEEPGPMQFVVENVVVHPNGSLTLYNRPYGNGSWTGGEIYSDGPMGHGTYSFVVESDISHLPALIDFDMFLWEDDTWDIGNREVDIEISKFGYPVKPENSQFAVLPQQGRGGNIKRFDIPAGPERFYGEFTWSPCGITFRASKGDQHWEFEDPTFRFESRQENVHITMWCIDGKNPWETTEDIAVTVESFKFTPLAETNPDYILKC